MRLNADRATGLFVGLVLMWSCFARMGFETSDLQSESRDHDWIEQIRPTIFGGLVGVQEIR